MIRVRLLSIIVILSIVNILVVSCKNENKKKKVTISSQSVSTSTIIKKLNQFVPIELKVENVSNLTDKEKQILSILIDVSDIVDEIFWLQVIGEKNEFLKTIKDTNLKKFAIENYGPWDRFNDNLPFIFSYGRKPLGANFYPKDMTKPEFERFEHPEKTNPYTIIVRDENRNLKVVPYNEAYKDKSEKIASLLGKAADLAENPTLKKYLLALKKAFLTNDWKSATIAWLELKDTNIDFIIGPIENYEDALFGYKNTYESMIFITDNEWSKKIENYKTYIPWLQNELGLDKKYIKPLPKNQGEIKVCDLIYASGDANAEAKTIAIQLPNEEDIIEKYGSRNIQIRNIIKAKFDNILQPIAKIMLDKELHSHIKFESFFSLVLFQKLANLMGIRENMQDRKDMRESLRDKYSVLEEVKADMLCIYMISKLLERGEIKESDLLDIYVTYVANIFRTVRFGISNVHGRARMVIFNYITEYGGIKRNPQTGTYTIDEERFKQAATILLKRVLAMQGNRDYLGVVKLINQKGHIRLELSNDFEKVYKQNIPIDIRLIQGKKILGL